MIKFITTSLLILSCHMLQAQELYVVTEPASNIPSGSIAAGLINRTMKMEHDGKYHYRIEPEMKIGISKKLMAQVSLYGSNMFQKDFRTEGVGVYAKYRLLSMDDIYSHFRVSVFGKISMVDNPDTVGHSVVHNYGGGILHLQNYTYASNEIDLDGNNSGFNTGIVATQLLHKLALSGSVAYTNRWKNGSREKIPGSIDEVINYSFSTGYLLFPVKYQNYNQTNVNIYMEFLGASALDKEGYYIDAAPSVQFIFHSISRLDLSYRTQVKGNVARFNNNSWLMRFEYNFLNVFKKTNHKTLRNPTV